MIYNYKELLKKYENDYQISLALNKNEIWKVEEGIYSDTEYPSETAIIAKKYPNAIFTMDNAFYAYGLTDVIPRKYHLAIRQNRKKIIDPKVESIYISKEFFEIGKTTLTVNNAVVNIYDKERMLIELVRNKNQIPYDYYKEILNNFRDNVEDLEIRKIQQYIKHFKNGDLIFRTIRNEVY